MSGPAPSVAAPKYSYALGYLRAFLVVLVVAHHAVLAYHPFAPPPSASLVAQPRWWQAFPIVDTARWSGFSLLVGFNDVFFMSLMFFLSGLFVWPGLRSKGSARFFRSRLLRLGVPFIVATAAIAPLAYYPAYLQTVSHGGFSKFWNQWISLGQWPSGPAWFIWVLLAFDGIAALLFMVVPGWGETLGRMISRASARTATFYALLAVCSAIVYIPMALIFTPVRWAAFGPFTFQTSRILHYLAYFAMGVGVGACGLNSGLLAHTGKLARRWTLWTIAAVLVFAGATIAAIIASTSQAQSREWAVTMDAGFVLSCAASSLAFLSLFSRFANSRSRFFDELSANSYGIYLVHYVFVTWLQYALLPWVLPAAAKGGLVFLGALGLSWGLVGAIRRIPAIARVI